MGWFDDDDDEFESVDEESDDEAEEDDELPAEDAASLARLDKAFRELRARVRACSDLAQLRAWRAE